MIANCLNVEITILDREIYVYISDVFRTATVDDETYAYANSESSGVQFGMETTGSFNWFGKWD